MSPESDEPFRLRLQATVNLIILLPTASTIGLISTRNYQASKHYDTGNMPSTQGSLTPSEFEFRGELTPAPLYLEQNQDQDDQAVAVVAGDDGGGVIVDELYFRDEETATIAEYLAHYNASGNTTWVAQVAEVCAEILDGHAVAAPPAPVDQLSGRDLLVRRKKRHIDRIFNRARAASEEDCGRAIKAFKVCELT